jgi:hypothetical protein
MTWNGKTCREGKRFLHTPPTRREHPESWQLLNALDVLGTYVYRRNRCAMAGKLSETYRIRTIFRTALSVAVSNL